LTIYEQKNHPQYLLVMPPNPRFCGSGLRYHQIQGHGRGKVDRLALYQKLEGNTFWQACCMEWQLIIPIVQVGHRPQSLWMVG
jgi:hypothetical protein